jgi:hypothetical protein
MAGEWNERDALLRAGYEEPGARLPRPDPCCRACLFFPFQRDPRGDGRAPIFETLRGLRAEDRFDDEPRDLIGKTVFVKDHGQGQVLDFSKARIGSSQ